jgi:predicted lactoylglutathione lyase
MNADLIQAKVSSKHAGDDLRQELIELCEIVASLEVRLFLIAGPDKVDEMIRRLREAGLKAWDDVADPETLIREMRGDDDGD